MFLKSSICRQNKFYDGKSSMIGQETRLFSSMQPPFKGVLCAAFSRYVNIVIDKAEIGVEFSNIIAHVRWNHEFNNEISRMDTKNTFRSFMKIQ